MLFRSKYVGNNSAVGNIISNLTFPDKITYDSFELYTNAQPYSVTVNFKTDRATQEYYSDEANQQEFLKNAFIMFSLIENVEYITFSLDTEESDPFTFEYISDQAKSLLGENYFEQTNNIDSFTSVLDVISAYDGDDGNSDDGDYSLTPDQAVIKALSDTIQFYAEGECFGEGHIILGTETDGDNTKIYTLTMVGYYGFVNDNFEKISGSGIITAVVTLTSNNEGIALL